MKVIAFIPCRYGSNRFPGKPLVARIGGKSMIQCTYESAKSCSDITDVYVATDDDRIAQCVRGFGGNAIMTGQEHPSGTDRIAEAARKCGLKPDDIVVNIQGDQPYFHPSLITDLIRPLQEDPDIPMSTLQYRMTQEEEIQHPNNVKTVSDSQGFALFFSRATIPYYRDGEIHSLYFKHLGFYGYRMRFLETFSRLAVTPLEEAEKLEQLRALENGYRIMVIEVMHDSIEVDTPQDIRRVEAMMAQSGVSES